MGHGKIVLKESIYSNTCLYQETRKNSDKHPNVPSWELGNAEQKA